MLIVSIKFCNVIEDCRPFVIKDATRKFQMRRCLYLDCFTSALTAAQAIYPAIKELEIQLV